MLSRSLCMETYKPSSSLMTSRQWARSQASKTVEAAHGMFDKWVWVLCHAEMMGDLEDLGFLVIDRVSVQAF